MGKLEELREYVDMFSTAPTLEKMPRRNLADKGIAGPTGAHVIEELHTPFNFSYITVTTGTTAFQNLVGVTQSELPDRIAASHKALELSGVAKGDHILITYPPLVNVFPKQSLEKYGVTWSFLQTSSRDALILALCEKQPRVVLGESSFLRATLEDAKKMGFLDRIPKDIICITAGTPLDLDFPETAKRLVNGTVHDLYGCQEFGWLTLDGIPLREDISLVPCPEPDYRDLIVGGLPTGDRFPLLDSGHICNVLGKIITYSRIRSYPEHETTILQSTVSGLSTLERTAKTILRIKSKIVRIAPDVVLDAEKTILCLNRFGVDTPGTLLDTPEQTGLFDTLVKAQLAYQSQSKTDPTWIKGR